MRRKERIPSPKDRPTARVGWREWVGLPDLGIGRIQAKIDTGAKTSALHAVDIELFDRDGAQWVRFSVPRLTRKESVRPPFRVEAPIVDEREVRSSNGNAELRPVIQTTVHVGDALWSTLLTLTDRGAMGFRLLLGRRALEGKVLVDAGASFLLDPTP